MAFPIIYSNKKHVCSGQEVTLSRGPWDGTESDTPWTITLLQYNQDSSILASGLTSVSFKSDGSKMFTLNGNSVFEHSLSANWDITSAVEEYEYDITSVGTSQYGVQVKPDGSRMWTHDVDAPGRIFEYGLLQSWELSSATYSGTFIDLDGSTLIASMQFAEDGFSIIAPIDPAGGTPLTVAKYELSAAWDITTMGLTPTQTVDLTSDINPGHYIEHVSLSPDGTKMFVLEEDGYLREYELGTPFDLNTLSIVLVTRNLTAQGSFVTWVEYNPNFTDMYICDGTNYTIDQYDTNYSTLINNIWNFPDSTLGIDYEILAGDIYSVVLTIRILKTIEEFTVEQIITSNKVLNSTDWVDLSGASGVADNWNAPTTTQTNTIETGWNFSGKSQRVTQGTGRSYIYQDGLVDTFEGHNISLKYRASKPLTIQVGGRTFNLPITEASEFNIYPIQHSQGVVAFEGLDGGGNEWILTDGTFLATDSFSKNLPAGTSYLIMDDFTGSSITSLGTGLIYVGDLQDIPKNVGIIELEDTNVAGDIIELNHILETVYISNASGVYGEVQALSGLTGAIDLNGCSGVSGDISSLTNAQHIILNGCPVSGVLPSGASYIELNLSDTSLTFDDLNDTIINASEMADAGGINTGYFECYDNMPWISGSEACAAWQNLLARDWDVVIRAFCGGSWYG